MASKRTGILTASIAGLVLAVAAAGAVFVVTHRSGGQPGKPPKDISDTRPDNLALPAWINAGGPALTEGGQAWSADAGFVGGIAEASGAQTGEHVDHTVRRGVSAYRLAVDAPGIYRVTLYLVEPTYDAPGKRVFDVLAQGSPVLAGVDIAAAAGKGQPYQRTFDTKVTGGVLDVGFLPRVGLPLIAGLAVATSPAARPTPVPPHPACRGTVVTPKQDPRAVVAAHPAGTTFCFRPGVYRLKGTIAPKDGDVLAGDAGAILSGARQLGGWAENGTTWHARAALARSPVDNADTKCIAGTACKLTTDVYLDSHPLRRVLRAGDVGPGTFFQDERAGRIVLGDDPTGRVVEQAVVAEAVRSKVPGVTVRGLVVEKFAAPAQGAALYAEGPGWRILDNEVRLNHGGGVRTDERTRAVGNSVHNNGQIGMGGNGDGAVVSANVIALNNYGRFDPDWEAGASKWAFTADLKLTGNNVYANGGPGLWADLDNVRTTISGNLVANNGLIGIFEEISCSASITGNLVVGNGFSSTFITGWLGGSGIGVNTSSDVEIASNTVLDNANGIGLIASDRGQGDTCGHYELKDVRVRGNQVRMRGGRSGVVEDLGSGSVFNASSLRFSANAYRLDQPERPAFAWRGQSIGREQWLQAGQDAGATFETAN